MDASEAQPYCTGLTSGAAFGSRLTNVPSLAISSIKWSKFHIYKANCVTPKSPHIYVDFYDLYFNAGGQFGDQLGKSRLPLTRK